MRISIGFELETAEFAFIQVHRVVDKYYLRPFPSGTKYRVPNTKVEIYGDVSSEAVFQRHFPEYKTCPYPIRLLGRSRSGENQQFIITQTYMASVINDAEFVVTFPDPIEVENDQVSDYVLDKYLDSLHLIFNILTNTAHVYELENRPPTFAYKYLIFPTTINTSAEEKKYGFLSVLPPHALVTYAHFTSQATIGMDVRDVSLVLLSLKFWEINPQLAFFFHNLLEHNDCFSTLSLDRQALVKQLFVLVVYTLNRGSHHRKNVSLMLLRNSCQNLLRLLTDEEKHLLVACVRRISSNAQMKRAIENDLNLVLRMERHEQGETEDRWSYEHQITRAFQERVVQRLQDIVTRPLSRARRNQRQFLTDVGLIQDTDHDRVYIEIRIFKDWLKKELDLPRGMVMSIHGVMVAVDRFLIDRGYFLENE